MSSEESWIGSVIGERYAIERRVARGGMSTVYLAKDQRLHREVAIKVLFPHMAEDRKVVQRFEQEARNSALISHPNVVQVLDQGQTRETAYMVMEYVPGATLRTLLKRGPMTPRLTLAYAQAILSGLSAAHRAGLVHRDIKPENVLVSPEGRIKLADFGLARAATHHSGTSTLMGTVAYISPELLSGEGADERADIYAVGILLYEMLTGVQPYTGDSPVRVAFQHVNSTVPAPSSYVPGLAETLDSLVREATRADPADRPKNADELLEQLEAVRDELTEEQLDFDGALVKHRRHNPPPPEDFSEPETETDDDDAPAAGTSEATQVMPAGSAEEPLEDDEDEVFEEDLPGAEDFEEESAEPATAALPGAAEDFPTAEDGDQDWDEDVTTALGQAQAAPPPRPQAPAPAPQADPWATLAVEDRQTVAEVPLPTRLSVADAETGPQPARQPQRTHTPIGKDKKQRQRPVAELNGPTPARQGIAAAVVMIVLAVVMLLGFQLGISESLIPSLP
ncbi:serine/threonine protein kinase [Nesterenkonia sp. MY13]|uniref:non-specific serine/threonine protein kinase n=1 Tax=Nesterenkonia sedimenti TaxID=1463632 RepID=A0A7X8YE58_9MICC|nr:protein kinase [Nesterenkonia sedimenti]NLS10269.1 serine/threonine protein kinase [Nesterenkonia sedimenti]